MHTLKKANYIFWTSWNCLFKNWNGTTEAPIKKKVDQDVYLFATSKTYPHQIMYVSWEGQSFTSLYHMFSRIYTYFATFNHIWPPKCIPFATLNHTCPPESIPFATLNHMCQPECLLLCNIISTSNHICPHRSHAFCNLKSCMSPRM